MTTPQTTPPTQPTNESEALDRLAHAARVTNTAVNNTLNAWWQNWRAHRRQVAVDRSYAQAVADSTIVRVYQTPAEYQRDVTNMRRAGYAVESVVEQVKQPSFFKLIMLGFIFARPKSFLVVTYTRPVA